jgi:hypothetical protein
MLWLFQSPSVARKVWIPLSALMPAPVRATILSLDIVVLSLRCCVLGFCDCFLESSFGFDFRHGDFFPIPVAGISAHLARAHLAVFVEAVGLVFEMFEVDGFASAPAFGDFSSFGEGAGGVVSSEGAGFGHDVWYWFYECLASSWKRSRWASRVSTSCSSVRVPALW